MIKFPPIYTNILQQASQYYQSQLPHSEKAEKYVLKRGLSEAIIQRYAIGYAPAGWGNLLINIMLNCIHC